MFLICFMEVSKSDMRFIKDSCDLFLSDTHVGYVNFGRQRAQQRVIPQQSVARQPYWIDRRNGKTRDNNPVHL